MADQDIYAGESAISKAQSEAEKVQAIWKERTGQFPHDKKLRKLGNEVIREMSMADSCLCDGKAAPQSWAWKKTRRLIANSIK